MADAPKPTTTAPAAAAAAAAPAPAPAAAAAPIVPAAAAAAAVPAADDDGERELTDAERVSEANEMLTLLKQPALADAIAAAKAAIMGSAAAAPAGGAASAPAATAAAAPAAAAAATPAAAPAAATRGGAPAGGAGGGGGGGGGKHHAFWDTQPVPKLGEEVESQGPIDAPKTVADIQAVPYTLPAGFQWVTIDATDMGQLHEMHTLLRENYVEDDENMFRFAYSEDFLKWALTPPGYYPDWLVGIRTKSGALVACITGVPATIQVYDAPPMRVCEINFLCAHKKLRSKRLAPVLIKEVTRRVNLKDIFQAVYTAGVVLPKPVTSCQYWHRNLNPKKLIECGFTRLAPRMTLNRTVRLYALPEEPKVTGVRPMVAGDVPVVTAMLNKYLAAFALRPVFSEEEVTHTLLPRPGVVDAFVVADAGGTVTDFISYYYLPSSVLGNAKHTTLSAVYAYYNVPGAHTLKDLMETALILALKAGVDVFNCLDLMDNKSVVTDLKFGPGDGHLQYYLYNWRCPGMPTSKMGLVLL